MNKEQFVELKKYPGYYATKNGDIYSAYIIGGHGKKDRTNLHKLSYGKDRDGYYRVVLSQGGKKMYKKVHTLIAEQFLGEIIPPMVVNHKDGNKQNNSADNLEIVSVKENTVHAHENGLTSRETPVSVLYDGKEYHFSSLDKCMQWFPELSRHYLAQLKRREMMFSMVEFVKTNPSIRISPINCYYNGELFCTFQTMQDADHYFNVQRGTTSSAIKCCKYRHTVNKYHVTFPNVSTIENTSVSDGNE